MANLPRALTDTDHSIHPTRAQDSAFTRRVRESIQTFQLSIKYPRAHRTTLHLYADRAVSSTMKFVSKRSTVMNLRELIFT